MLRIVRVLVIVAAVAAPAVAFGGEKEVRVDVDGRTRVVRTYATSAPDLLRRIGMRPSALDLVSPLGALEAGTVVQVRRGKPIHLLLDGRPTVVWVHGLTVGEALEELGMRPGQEDFVWPASGARLVDGLQVVLRNAVHLTVAVDGKTRDVVSNATRVGDALRRGGVRLGPEDRVSPSVDAFPTPDMKVRIVRVRRVIQTDKLKIPFTHREAQDAKLEKGLRRMRQRGAEGVKVRRYATLLENGKPVSRKFLDEKVVRKPRDEIVAVGTGVPKFRGGGHVQEGLASWYHFEGLGAAHRSLPFGTVVKVTNLANGRTINVVIRDRGPFVDGRVIDLSNTAFREIAPLGAGTARVKMEW